MADPLTEIFGRRTFRGTGRADDYFPEAPDLSYLGRPSFVPRGTAYNPNLDPAGAIAAGFSPRNAQILQGFRQQLHQGAEQERFMRDEDAAFNALQKLDPASRNFSTQLLDIFRKNPRAQQSPEILGQVEFLSRFAPKTPQFSVEDIEDPDVYDLAVKENWSNLSPTEAKRRANKVVMQRQMRGELAGLGLPKEDLDKVKDWTQEDYLREKGRLLREAKQKSVEPWTQRLSDKEREAVRMEVQTAMAPSDFEEEFDAVLKKNPGLTKDAYVKQFKGDPDYASYQLRRAMESGVPQKLIREYGLNQDEVASLFGVQAPSKAPQPVVEDAFKASQSFAPGTTQNAPQAAPVPNTAVPAVQPQATPTPPPSPTPQPQQNKLSFPTIGMGAQTPAERIVSAGKTAFSNIGANASFDPLATVAAATRPGGMQELMTTPPPTEQEQNKAWTDAKEKVRSFIEKMPVSPEERVKYLGSMAAEETVPMDFFTKKKSQGDKAFFTASSALEKALFEENPDLPKTAIRDKGGRHEWKDVARMVALEELEKMGYITRSSQASPAPSPSQAKVPNIKSIQKIQ